MRVGGSESRVVSPLKPLNNTMRGERTAFILTAGSVDGLLMESST